MSASGIGMTLASESASTSNGSGISSGIIAGAAIGGVAGVAIIAILLGVALHYRHAARAGEAVEDAAQSKAEVDGMGMDWAGNRQPQMCTGSSPREIDGAKPPAG